jgi:chromosome segregation ATPase
MTKPHEPMSEERLAEISARAAKSRMTTYYEVPVELVAGACKDVPDLVAEVRRLQGEVDFITGMRNQARVHVKQAEHLLLERARQTDELIRERDDKARQLERMSRELADAKAKATKIDREYAEFYEANRKAAEEMALAHQDLKVELQRQTSMAEWRRQSLTALQKSNEGLELQVDALKKKLEAQR